MYSDSKKTTTHSNLEVRVSVFNIIITVFFIILIINLFNLQIIKGWEYKEKAKDLMRRETPITSQRGKIFDRNDDIPMVYNIDSFAVDIVPGEINENDMGQVFKNLSELLKIDISYIRQKVPKEIYKQYYPIEIKNGVSFKTIATLAEHIEDYPGVRWYNKPIRGYINKDSIAHIIGYVGDITRDELNILYNKGYTHNSTIGKTGIEKKYDELLKGTDGKRYKMVDVKEKQSGEIGGADIPPVPGNNLVLTIDRKIQVLCEKALGKRIGSIVVLKPTTGEILALVSYPWFDPSIFYSETRAEDFKKLSFNPEFPFLNRTIQSVYPPASVFKIIMSAGLIEENSFSLENKITCKGEMRLGDRIFHCWQEYGHGAVNYIEAFQQSCNIYFYTIGREELGVDNIVHYAKEFGIGTLTGIDLPREVQGFLPSPEWKLQKYHIPWFGGDTMNISIGQGWVSVTPLQLATVISLVVNEGVVYQPYILKEVRDPVTDEIIEEIKKKILSKSSIKKETFKIIKKAMRGVVTNGTGTLITTKAVKVAGKTGTPETGLEDRYHSWFASFAPYETENIDESVVIVAMIEASEEKQWWASKTVNIVYQGIFNNQTYEEAMIGLYPWLKNTISPAINDEDI